jgi:uncharacterized protein (DUF1330 family)
MPAYLILQNTVKDEERYQKYAQAAWPLMIRFGAKPVARRGKVEILEGEHDQHGATPLPPGLTRDLWTSRRA